MDLTCAESMPDESSFDEPSGACAAVDFNKEENQKTIKEILKLKIIFVYLIEKRVCLS